MSPHSFRIWNRPSHSEQAHSYWSTVQCLWFAGGAEPRPPSPPVPWLHRRYIDDKVINGLHKIKLTFNRTNPDSNVKYPRQMGFRTASTNSPISQLVPLLPFVHYALKRLPPSETPVPPAPAHLLVSHLAARMHRLRSSCKHRRYSSPVLRVFGLLARRSWYWCCRSATHLHTDTNHQRLWADVRGAHAVEENSGYWCFSCAAFRDCQIQENWKSPVNYISTKVIQKYILISMFPHEWLF